MYDGCSCAVFWKPSHCSLPLTHEDPVPECYDLWVGEAGPHNPDVGGHEGTRLFSNHPTVNQSRYT